MTPAELAPLLTTFGPMGVVIWWVLRTQAESKKTDHPDPVITKLDSIQQTISGMEKRRAIVETKIEERNK